MSNARSPGPHVVSGRVLEARSATYRFSILSIDDMFESVYCFSISTISVADKNIGDRDMTRISRNMFAALFALFITVVSFQEVVTVPATASPATALIA